MANITAAQVQKLRLETGLSMMEIKKALVDANGDEKAAMQLLKERGLTKAASRMDRVTSEGTFGVYIHTTKKLVATVALLCETDFVARSDDFQEVAKKLAMHVAAANPAYVTSDEIPADIIEAEKLGYAKQLEAEGKSKDMLEKILPGKLEKFYADQCLMNQAFILDPEVQIADMVNNLTHKLGEKISIGAISRQTI